MLTILIVVNLGKWSNLSCQNTKLNITFGCFTPKHQICVFVNDWIDESFINVIVLESFDTVQSIIVNGMCKDYILYVEC